MRSTSFTKKHCLNDENDKIIVRNPSMKILREVRDKENCLKDLSLIESSLSNGKAAKPFETFRDKYHIDTSLQKGNSSLVKNDRPVINIFYISLIKSNLILLYSH